MPSRSLSSVHQQSTIFSANKPIGIFDSGLGGISIARHVAKALPNENILYFADCKHAPYGDKGETHIIDRVNSVADYLVSLGAKAIVLACNTATVNAIEQLRTRVDVPIIGVEPAIKPAAQLSASKSVGMMVTSATSKNPRFLKLVETHKGDATVHIQACPGLVEVIEKGEHDSAHCRDLLEAYLTPLLAKRIDTLVLGCTHYPLISAQIIQIVGDNVTLLETSEPVTKELTRQLTSRNMLAGSSNGNTENLGGQYQVLSTGEYQSIANALPKFWLENVSIEADIAT